MHFELPLLFCIGFFASFIGSLFSGSTSSLALGLMFISGIPPYLAISTYKFGILGWRLGGFHEFLRAGKIRWPLVIPLSLCGLLGSFVGAKLLIHTSEIVLSRISGIVLGVFLFFAIIQKKSGITP